MRLHIIDWLVLLAALIIVFAYGYRQQRKSKAAELTTDYLRGNQNLKWWTIGLSIMATQASAVTFLSTPGQAYQDGMEFAQLYFGMPLAMILIAYFVLPYYYKLKVTTAYEFLEHRFSVSVRTFAAVIFLILRGVSAAITLLAPSIVLSVALGWNLELTTLAMTIFVVIYTTLGGNEAVSRTQELQMTIMLLGLLAAFVSILYLLPQQISLTDAWHIAELSGRTKIIDTQFSWTDRYNIWSGLLATVFLFLSYFGTDQSQVGRYLSGRTLQESRIGLIANGLIKIPMQLLVLSVGVMLFVYFQINPAPVHFNPENRAKVEASTYAAEYRALDQTHTKLVEAKSQYLQTQLESERAIDRNFVAKFDQEIKQLRSRAKELIKQADPKANATDTDYVFIHFVLTQFPKGLIGFILAMIFCAAWSTTASELSALTAATVNDLYRRSIYPQGTEAHYLRAAKWSQVIWGCILACIALKAGLFENLIQAVNMAGSVFYGTILGIFATAFYLRNVNSTAVMIGAAVAQGIVIYLFFGYSKDAYLWYIPLATGVTMLVGWAMSKVQPAA